MAGSNRLEKIFEKLGTSTRGPKCKGMEGLLEESSSLIEEEDKGDVLDAGIICGAQKVEHYEIAGYGTVCTFAELLGEEETLELLKQTLEEEKATDEKLTKLATSTVNLEAAAEGDSGEEKSAGKGQRGGTSKTKTAAKRR